MSLPTFLIVDTETTGLKGKACEIAWIEVDLELNELDRVSSLIDPEEPIESGATAVHGIRDEDVISAPTAEEFFSIVHPRKFESVVILAHNAPFDRKRLDPYMPIDLAVCTLQIARRVVPKPQVPNHQLQTLRSVFGLPGGEEHRAMGDCITVLHLMRHLCKVSYKPFAEWVRLSEKPSYVDVMPYGKHAGQKMTDVPADYRAWLLSTNLSRDMRYTLEQLGAAGV